MSAIRMKISSRLDAATTRRVAPMLGWLAAAALACVVASCTTSMPPGPPPPPPGQDCIDNTTAPCLCPDGHTAAQTCISGHYGVCQCDGQPPPPPPPGPTKKHGDVCVAPQFNCGSDTGIQCIVDHPGDAQGICRRVCGSFSTCLNDSDALHRFDTDCCAINNGSRVCDMKSMFPAGACN